MPGLHRAINILHKRPASERMMEMNNYSQTRMLELFRSKGMVDIICQPLFDEFAIGFVYFGRKPSA